MPTNCWLFSYGTLLRPDVQRATFGRTLDAVEDALAGYRLGTVAITDPAVVALSGSGEHPTLIATGNPADRISGMALAVTDAELAAADRYEAADYVRIEVTLASGRQAFAYAARANAPGDNAMSASDPPSISLRSPTARGAMRAK
jgi:hypothetical protein